MDLLFRRYASPFPFMDGMIQTCQFCDFIHNFAEAKQESDEWEIYLHKVWDKSFTEFKKEIKANQDHRKMSESQIETAIKDSMNILNNFNPEQQEGD